ncbi:hypothetical protein [Thermofilum pendens]|uniref:Uncharacterized protein n=1 Tax=Thermofilum pendens (strain DSM 2475 / Hrk 5) TaxID=368408 RepID=A1S117_THEPD|nr:hypothetical protein [Thermofilum pendens]ABL79147.1 hypothetical protein Tpen_1752 [Thermofilum pendens Hrk 5]
MRRSVGLASSLKKTVRHELFVSGKVAAATSLLAVGFSFLQFFLVLAYASSRGLAGGPPFSYFPLMLMSYAYGFLVLMGLSSLAGELKGSAALYLSQPLSRSEYVASWALAVVVSPLASLVASALFSAAVVDPALLWEHDPSLYAFWVLENMISGLLLLLVALLGRSSALLVVTWLVQRVAAPFVTLFLASLSRIQGRALNPLLEFLAQSVYPFTLYYSLNPQPHAVAGSAVLVATLAVAVYLVTSRRLEV